MYTKKPYLLIAGLTAAVFLSTTVQGQPGDIDDPVVTKSYVDKAISEISGGSGPSGELSEYQLEFIIDEVAARLGTDNNSQSQGNSFSVTGASYTPVQLSQGQVLIGGEGAEIILRSGQATGYTIVADGLVNATTGTEVKTGDALSANHLLIVPRGDGRGVLASSDVWLIVKGAYSVLN